MPAQERLTPHTHKAVLDVLRAGNYMNQAAEFAGVGRSTIYSWIARGREAWERAMEEETVVWAEDPETGEETILDYGCPEGEVKYVRFWRDLQKTNAEAEIRLVTHWATSARTDWRAAKELLARRFPERWGERPTEVDLNVLDVNSRVVERSEPTPRRVAAAIRNDGVRAAAILAVLEEAGAIPEGTVDAATIPLAELESGASPDSPPGTGDPHGSDAGTEAD